MAEPFQPKNPAEEMLKFWQTWMGPGTEAMQRMMSVPSASDLQRVVQEVAAVRSQVEAVATGLGTLEAVIKAQQQMWQALEGSVQRAVKGQDEILRAMAAWGSQWEQQMTSGLEQWRQRWEDMLRQGMTMSQNSQQQLEGLTRTMLDVSQKVLGGTRREP